MVLVIIVDILYYAGIGLHLNTSLNFFFYLNTKIIIYFPFTDDTLKIKYLFLKKEKNKYVRKTRKFILRVGKGSLRFLSRENRI